MIPCAIMRVGVVGLGAIGRQLCRALDEGIAGLTLAGARRRLEEEETPIAADAPEIDELIGQNARERLTAVKRGLRSILDLLSGVKTSEFRLTPPPRPAASARVRPMPVNRVKSARGKPTSSRRPARRKRSA